MASIRKSKKLGIYKAPKYTKERAELLKETRDLVDKANRRLKGLKNAGYEGTWASRKLEKRLEASTLKAWDKSGKIKIRKNMTNTQLIAIQKKTKQFMESKTSKASGIRDVRKTTIDSLRATFSKDVALSDIDVETAYDMLSDNDFDYFNNDERIGASTLWALIEDAIEYEQTENTFLNRLLNMYESSNDKDARLRAKRLYEKYVL